jgi:hypothetical protein
MYRNIHTYVCAESPRNVSAAHDKIRDAGYLMPDTAYQQGHSCISFFWHLNQFTVTVTVTLTVTIMSTDAFEEMWEQSRGKQDGTRLKFFLNKDCDGDSIPDIIEGANDTDKGTLHE